MAHIVIEDLPVVEALSAEEMEEIFGAGFPARRLSFEGLENRTMFSAVSVFAPANPPVSYAPGQVPAAHGVAVAGTVTAHLTEAAPQAAPGQQITGYTWLASTLTPTPGQSVTFIITFTNNQPITPGGTVTFYDGGTVIDTSTLNSAGQASFSHEFTTGGNHTLSFTYISNNPAVAGSPTPVNLVPAGMPPGTPTLTVARATVGMSLKPANGTPAAPVYGQWVGVDAYLTIPTTPGLPRPGGTVTFFDNGREIGKENVDGPSGTASWGTTAGDPLGAGQHNITAVYSGDPNYALITAPVGPCPVNVQKASTNTVAFVSQSHAVFGEAVTISASVAVDKPGSGTPGGSVTFLDNGGNLRTVPLNADGTATVTISTLGVGSHDITARYNNNDGNFIGSSSPSSAVAVNVDKAETDVAINASANPATFGQMVNFTANITAAAPGGGVPAGEVTFYVDGQDVGPITLNAAGAATFSTSNLGVGSHLVTAEYAGSGNYYANNESLTEAVGKANVGLTLNSSLPTSPFGSSVTFTAVVTGVPGKAAPTKQVIFKEGETVLATEMLPISDTGVVTFTTSSLSAGLHNITAEYEGDPNYELADAITTQTVVGEATTTSLKSSMNPSPAGQLVTFTATVGTVPGHGTPTGTVTFLDGSAVLGVGTVVNGTASFSTAALGAGNHAISASYSPADVNFATSSGSLTQRVLTDSTTTSVSASQTSSMFGQSLTFTASVAVVGVSSGTPVGNVTFSDGGKTLATVALTNGRASFSTAALGIGQHTIMASFASNGSFAASSGTSPFVTVQKATPIIALSSTTQGPMTGQTVTFTVAVGNGAAGTAGTGNVSFIVKHDGMTLQNHIVSLANGVATYAIPAGTQVGFQYTIYVSYPGDPNFNAGFSNAITVTIE